MKINELAKKFNITARTLRFYEEKGLLSPVKQDHNSYRMYDSDDENTLKWILGLREIGLSINEIKDMLRTASNATTREISIPITSYLEQQYSLLAMKLCEIQDTMKTIDQLIELENSNGYLHFDEIYLVTQKLASIRSNRSSCIDIWNFDQLAPYHDKNVLREYDQIGPYKNYKYTLEKMIQLLQVKPGETGLDVCVGTGTLAGMLLEQGAIMNGIDLSAEMLANCREKFPEIEVKLSNCLALPYPHSKFDFVVNSFSLKHLSSAQKEIAISEIVKVVKDTGRICIADIMFDNEEKLMEYKEAMVLQGNVEAISLLNQYYYSSRDHLVHHLEQSGFHVESIVLDQFLYILYASR